MSQELQLGKYKFYPYEFDNRKTPTLEEIVELWEKIRKKKARPKKSVSCAKRRARE